MVSPSKVKESLQKRLEKEQHKLRYKVQTNKREMKSLVESQTMMKREIAELNVLIQSLKVVELVEPVEEDFDDDLPF